MDPTGKAALAAPLTPVTLVVGPESFLAERAVSRVIDTARSSDPDADLVDVTAGALEAGALAEHTSPSLFASRRVVVVRELDNAGSDVAAELVALASAPAEDVHLVLVHPGGTKGRATLDALRATGAPRVACDRLTRAEDQVEFVRAEVRGQGARIDEAAARSLVEAVGPDLRALSAAAAQLAVDASGPVTRELVATYFEGRAEVKGFVVADRTVEGRTAEALEQLRWALATGTAPVLVSAALAGSLRSLGRLSGLPPGTRDGDVARELGVPSWKVRTLRATLRGWSPGGLAEAISVAAATDARVKGAGNDPVLALTRAVVEIGAARGRR